MPLPGMDMETDGELIQRPQGEEGANMREAVPPWERPAAISVCGGGSRT